MKKYIDFSIKKLYNNIPPQKFEVFKILNTYYTRIKIIYSLLSTIEGSFSIYKNLSTIYFPIKYNLHIV